MTGSVLITGCSSGVGEALALQCAKAGWTTFATVRKAEDAQMLCAKSKDIYPLICDVTNAAAVEATMDSVIKECGSIDALVANAGIGYVRSTEQASESEIEHVFNVNVMGVIRCVKAALPHMREAGSGHIVAVTSVGGLVGQPFNEIYCASKFAVEGYIEGLASYVTPGFGIDFTLVEPGGITSEFANTVLRKVGETGGILEDEYKPLIERYMGGRGARADGVYQSSDEVAAVILNLLGKDDPPLRTRTSEWSEDFTKLKTQADPDGTLLRDQVIAQMLGEDLLN